VGKYERAFWVQFAMLVIPSVLYFLLVLYNPIAWCVGTSIYVGVYFLLLIPLSEKVRESLER